MKYLIISQHPFKNFSKYKSMTNRKIISIIFLAILSLQSLFSQNDLKAKVGFNQELWKIKR